MKKKIKKGNTNATKRYDAKDFYSKDKINFKVSSGNAKKKRVPKTYKSMSKNELIVCGVVFAVLEILCLWKLGLFFAILTAIGVGIIALISRALHKAENNKKKKKVLNIILIIILAFGILCLAALSAFLIYITVKAPKFDTKQLDKKEVSIMYDKDGKEITKLGSEMREKVTYDELPEVLVDAIVSTEDSRFFQHNGFDAARFAKASLGQLAGNSDAGGASTLSMQVIKNSFTSTESSGVAGITRKFTDIYLSVFKLEKNYTKEQIIEFYVNNHFLGGNIYGVEEAAETYFGKSVSELNLSEAATLAGMFKSPNYYKPTANPKNATARRKTVLYLMLKHGYISKEEYDIANSIPMKSLTINTTEEKTDEYQGYIDTVVEELEDKYKVNPYTTSLEIHTNMDRSKQDAVNRVLNGESYNWINDKVQTGVSVLDSETGKLEAVGAGRNRSGASTFNYATQIKRQPGSTAKPLFDYGPGIEYNNWSTYGYQNGDNEYKLFSDAPYSYSNGRSIKNWDGGYFGSITLRRALSASRNIPALKAFQQVDNKKIISFVESLGITPEVENGKIHEAHSIGAFTGVSPVQMSGAYAGFSNGGYYNEPYTVSKLVYRDTGEVVEHKSEKKQVMSDATAFMISSVLQDVALTGGTPKNVACKTGTTNYDDNTMSKYNLPGDAIRDSWVVGYSNKTVIAMWYGYDTIDREFVLRNLPATIQKDRLFNALVSAGAMESNRSEFKQPSSVVKSPIAGTYEYFKKGYEPKNKTAEETKLSTPGNLNATLDSSGKVKITWSAVNKLPEDENYGGLVYNVYVGSTLVAVESGTSFTYDPKGASPYTTYKVVATYKSYSEAASNAASYTLNDTVELKLTCNPVSSTSGGGTYTFTSSDCVVKDGTTVVSGFTIVSDDGITLTDGTHNVTATGTYKSKSRTVHGSIVVAP